MAALLAILVIAALATGVMFAATETTKAGTAGATAEHALIAGESALVTAITSAGPQLPASIGLGGTTSYRADAEEWQVVVHITRLDSTTFWIVADARRPWSGTGEGKRVGVFVKTANRDDYSIGVDPISELAWAELF